MPQQPITEYRFTSVNISSGGGTASSALVLASSPTGLQPSQQIWLNGGSQAEDNYVASSYVPGSVNIPLVNPIQFGTQTQIFYNTHNTNGPQGGQLLPFGLVPYIPVFYDNILNAYVQLQGKQGVQYVTSGGDKSVFIPAATSTNTIVKNSAGRLAAILVSAVGTGGPIAFDNASAASGTPVGAVPVSAPVGLYVFNAPCLNGIVIQGNLLHPAMTVFYW